MIGLMLKDYYMTKKSLAISSVVIVLYAVFAIVEGNLMMLAYMSTLFAIFIPVTSISYDDKAGWNKYALTMPIKRKDLVICKYIVGYIGIAVAMLLYLIISTIVEGGFTVESRTSLLVALAIGTIIISLYIPATFKFGMERSRFIIIGICFLPTIGILLLSKMGVPAPSQDIIDLGIKLAPFAVILVAVLSIFISIHIMNHKEF